MPPPGREADVIDEADGIDVPPISGLKTSLRSAVGFCARALRSAGMALLDDVDFVGDVAAQTFSKYVSGSAGSYHSLIQNCV